MKTEAIFQQIINARLGDSDQLFRILWRDGVISDVLMQDQPIAPTLKTYDAKGELLLPGFCDIHIHSRDPGDSHKETWASISQAAYKGGVVMALDMPNTTPATLDAESILLKHERAKLAAIDKKFYLGITAKNLSHVKSLWQEYRSLLCGIKIYYGKSTGNLLFDDLKSLNSALPDPFDGILVFHAEDTHIIEKNQKSICPSVITSPQNHAVHSIIRSEASAFHATKTILSWGERYQRPLHLAHISTAQEILLARSHQERGHLVTTEVAPHHLFFDTKDYASKGARLRMNPPLRDESTKHALRGLFAQGMIDIFATDHAPHTREEKAHPSYQGCPSGVIGLELFTPLLLTLAKRLGLELTKAIKMAAQTPFSMLGSSANRGRIKKGFLADFCLVKEETYNLNPQDDPLISLCGVSPYWDERFDYRVLATWHHGALAYEH